MIANRLRRIRPVHAVAFVALLLAIGGTAYAGAKIGSKDVRNESLRGIDVKNGSLRGGELSRNAVGARELDAADDYTIGALVIDAQGDLDLANPDGIDAVEKTATGSYALTVTDGYVGCNLVASVFGAESGTDPVTITESAAEGQQVTFTISNGAGVPTDMEDIDGLFGFSVVGACPE